jgi:hypothetical protein
MRTLDHWRRRFTGSPCTIECSDMRLVGRDHEGTMFSGPGRIEIKGDTDIRFYVYGKTDDLAKAFRKYITAKENPYDHLEQFRLFATDYAGNEWAGGNTSVDFFTDHNRDWPLRGALIGLAMTASGPWVSTSSSVELLLIPPVSLPMSEALVSTSSIGTEVILESRSRGRQVVDVLGTQIIFANEPSDEALWITAETSGELRHPYAERWLSEPLRILLGAPIYPRMTARNFGNGKACVMVQPAPNTRNHSAYGLMRPWGTTPGHEAAFWKLYSEILTMIARESTIESFERGHQITRFYEELFQAGRGSRWVMLLTLASTVESLAKSLMTDADRRSEYSDKTLASIEAHIKGWDGDEALRERILNGMAQVRERSIYAFLRGLGAKGIIPDYGKTWRTLRNSVMHGQMVDPWSTEEGDIHLREMIELAHALTRERIAASARNAVGTC